MTHHFESSTGEQIGKLASDAGCASISDYYLQVSKGHVPGHTFVQKFGRNQDIGSAEETIWDAGGIFPYPSSASVIDIQSTNVNDAVAGSGAWAVDINGLDENWIEQTEQVALAGIATVQTTTTFIRVHRMTIRGPNGLQGVLTAEIASTVYSQIINGNNRTLQAAYTIPGDCDGYVIFGKVSASSGKDVSILFYTRMFGEVFVVAHAVELFSTNYDYFFKAPPRLPPKMDVEVRGVSSASGTKVSAIFDILLVKRNVQ